MAGAPRSLEKGGGRLMAGEWDGAAKEGLKASKGILTRLNAPWAYVSSAVQ